MSHGHSEGRTPTPCTPGLSTYEAFYLVGAWGGLLRYIGYYICSAKQGPLARKIPSTGYGIADKISLGVAPFFLSGSSKFLVLYCYSYIYISAVH